MKNSGLSFNSYTKHYSSLLSLGLPIVVGQLGLILVGFADTMMVGHYGTNDLASASFVNNLFNLAIIFSTGFSYGLTPVISNLFGKGEDFSIGRTLKNSLIVNSLIAVLLTAAMAAVYFNVERLGQPVELLHLIKPYYLILLSSIPFILLFNAFKQFADGIMDTKTSMWVLLSGNVMNIAGNYILIFGKCGMPEMGLRGAGISTLASRIAMLVIFIIIFLTSAKYRKYREGFISGTVNRADFSLLNRMGWPVGLQMGLETSSFSLSTIMVGWLGTVALASHQIMLTVGQLGFMLYYGMSAAIAVRVSYFKGQNDNENLKASANAGFQLVLAMVFIVSVLIFIFRNMIGGWFTDNTEASAMVAQLAIPFIIYQFGDGLQCTYSNVLRGIGDVKPVVLYAFIAYFAVSLPAGYLFGFILDWGLIGIWMSFPIGLTTAGVLFYQRYRRNI